MKYGLKEKTIEQIQAVFSKYPNVEKAVLYGSRAKGNYKNGSDIDLTLHGKDLTLKIQHKIANELDDLLLPYKIDLSIFDQISNLEFVDHILRVGVVFYQKKSQSNHGSNKEGWKVEKLGDVIQLEYGKPLDASKRSEDGKYPVYGANGEIARSNEYYYDKPTMIVGRKGSAGEINLTEKKFWALDVTYFVTFDDKKYDLQFLYYLLSKLELTKLAKGVKPGINRNDVYSIEVAIPPLPEQQRIVSMLDEAFASIAQAKSNAERNLVNARELFDLTLQNFLVKAGKKWGIKSLGDVCEKVEYGSSAKSQPTGKVPVLRMGNIQNGVFDWTNLVYTSDKDEIKKYLLKHNDVLFNRTNSPELVGKTAIYKSEMPAIFAGYLIRIHRKEDLLDADYLNYFLNSDMAMKYGKTVFISSVNQANINGQKLKSYPIPLPPLAEQRAIVGRLEALSAETGRLEEIYQQKVESLEELKKSVLAKAFAGELSIDN